MLSWSAWDNIVQVNYLHNVGPQSPNNFAQENNLQLRVDLFGLRLRKEIIYVMLAHD